MSDQALRIVQTKNSNLYVVIQELFNYFKIVVFSFTVFNQIFNDI